MGSFGGVRIGNGDGKGGMVGLQFARSLQQECGFQSFVPIRNDDVESLAGDFLNCAEDLRTTLHPEFQLAESLAQRVRGLLIGGKQQRERQHSLRLLCILRAGKLRSARMRPSFSPVTARHYLSTRTGAGRNILQTRGLKQRAEYRPEIGQLFFSRNCTATSSGMYSS